MPRPYAQRLSLAAVESVEDFCDGIGPAVTPRSRRRRMLELRKSPVHQVYANCAFAYRRGHPLDVARPNVTDREDPGKTGLQHLGRPLERPGNRSAGPGRIQVSSGEDETFLVQSK